MFEGLGDDAVTSIGRFDIDTPTAVVLYDLIPLISPDTHFRTNPVHIGYYGRKIDSLKRSAALLAISESSKGEALEALEFNPDRVTNISSGCDSRFHKPDMTDEERQSLCNKFGINKPFLMYTGGADERKNLHKLIEAFAELPRDLRTQYQLVMVGKMPEMHVADLRGIMKVAGLNVFDVVFTSYVSDLELMQLYSLCQLFVFPSLHEGFGLPPLEAMACGAPVIAANVTSLPEVMGREDAMFDPFSTRAISEKIRQVLKDDVFRKDLIRYGAQRVKIFSWDQSAKTAIVALERIAKPSRVVDATEQVKMVDTGLFKPLINRILVSKLDHMGDLVLAIPAIMKLRARYPYALIDALVGSWNAEAAKCLGVFENIHVLDYFAKKSSESAALSERALNSLTAQLKEYDLAIDLRRQPDTRSILIKIPARLHVGYTTGDESIDCRLGVSLQTVPDVPFETTELNGAPISLQMLRLVDALPADVNDYIRFPQLAPNRLKTPGSVAVFPKAGNEAREWGDQNFEALIRLLAIEPDVSGISVYTVNSEETTRYKKIVAANIRVLQGLPYAELIESVSSHTVCVSNNSFGAHIAAILGVQVIAVYLGQETVAEWAPVFGESRVIYTPVECSPCHIAEREDCKHDFICMSSIKPEYVHKAVLSALTGNLAPISRSVEDVSHDLIQAVAPSAAKLDNSDRLWLSSCIARSIQPPRKARLFLDISMLVCRDSKTGIQRVVRSILRSLLDEQPADFEVVPVYAAVDQPGYRQARLFQSQFMNMSPPKDGERLIDYQSGDVFLGLDLQPEVVAAQRSYLRDLRNDGVRVLFVVYDILFTLLPKYFNNETAEVMSQWLDVVAENDGAICISRAVADELSDWLKTNGPTRQRPFKIDWFHLGADIDASVPSKGIPDTAERLLQYMAERRSFLMVGTLEPRKGHKQALAAFEKLWEQGIDVNLIIVGKEGWLMESLAIRLRHHPEFNKRLFWLEGISDEYLEKIYAASTCLIAASEGEGFGLPLIEAAQHQLPIIARDIPVFREVTGEHAYYFSGLEAHDLAEAVKQWLTLNAEGKSPESRDMTWLTWKHSVASLKEVLFD
ncbi:MAG: glycosyltransferase [Methylobacter sp.]